MSRYAQMFDDLGADGAFVPFCMLGDPDPEQSLGIVLDLVAAGADALELGIPFSDPVADGPTIQAAGRRASQARTELCGDAALREGVAGTQRRRARAQWRGRGGVEVGRRSRQVEVVCVWLVGMDVLERSDGQKCDLTRGSSAG